MISADEALERLREGNDRFVANECVPMAITGKDRRALADAQFPFAIVLGCSDSRAPSEIIFDQGLGDLFSIRVAGNIVAPSQIGSVEFAADSLGVRLVVVMGHSGCGAVSATLSELDRPTPDQSPSLRSIVNRIRPSVEGLLADRPRNDAETLLRDAVHANVRYSVEQLRHGSEIVERLIGEGGLLVVGAYYDIASGRVDFLD